MDQDIEDYVKENLEKGFSPKAIKTVLLRSGYPKDKVENTIKKLAGKSGKEPEKPRELGKKGAGKGKILWLFLFSFAGMLIIPSAMLLLGAMAVYANYIWTLILAVITGIISLFMIKKSSSETKVLARSSLIISSLCSILTASCMYLLMAFTALLNNKVLARIEEVPNPLATGIIIFISYNLVFITEEMKAQEKPYKYLAYYAVLFVIVIAVIYAGKYLLELFV